MRSMLELGADLAQSRTPDSGESPSCPFMVLHGEIHQIELCAQDALYAQSSARAWAIVYEYYEAIQLAKMKIDRKKVQSLKRPGGPSTLTLY